MSQRKKFVPTDPYKEEAGAPAGPLSIRQRGGAEHGLAFSGIFVGRNG